MKIQTDKEGKEFIENLVSTSMKVLDHKSIVPLAIGLQNIKPLPEKDEDEGDKKDV